MIIEITYTPTVGHACLDWRRRRLRDHRERARLQRERKHLVH
jgi:hypothetical protein